MKVILHYSSLNLLTFIINTFSSSICWIVLVLINLFCICSSMCWTSLFDKFKLVCIFSSMLDVLNICSSLYWTWSIYSSMCWTCSNPCLVVQGFYLVFYLDEFTLLWRAYRRFISVVQRIFSSMDLAFLCRYNYFAPIGQLERGFPRWGSDSRSVCP